MLADRTGEPVHDAPLELHHDLPAMRVEGGHDVLPRQAPRHAVGASRQQDGPGRADPPHEGEPPARQGQLEGALGIAVRGQGEAAGQPAAPAGGQYCPREATPMGGHAELAVGRAMVVAQEPGAHPPHRGQVGAAVAVQDARLCTEKGT